MIEVIDFTKRYGEFVAVDDLSFSIGKGEIFGFIGPNGAGKSTTIRFLATLLRPTSGEGRVAGHSVVGRPDGRAPGHRLHARRLRRLRRHEGLGVPRLLRRRLRDPRTHRKKIIGEVLELLDLTHKRDDYVNGLSKGMKQRLCLAKTLVHDPPVLILDEPASGLDPRARLEMKALLERAAADGQDDPGVEPHPLGAGRLLHVDRRSSSAGRLLAAGSIRDIQRQLRAHRVLKVRVLDGDDRPGGRRSSATTRRSDWSRRSTTRSPPSSKGDDEDMARLLGRLIDAGLPVHSFAEEPLSLEEVFMMITKGIVS